MPQPGLLDFDDRHAKVRGIGDPLVKIRSVMEWDGVGRYSFRRFLDLTPKDVVRDAKTLWLARQSLRFAAVLVSHEREAALRDDGRCGRIHRKGHRELSARPIRRRTL
jgi:hypothetical protein